MALDPRIIMSARLPNIDVQKSFNNALLNIQAREGLEQQRLQAPLKLRGLEAETQQQETAAEEGIREAKWNSIVQGATTLLPSLMTGDFDKSMQILQTRFADLKAMGRPTDETERAMQTLIDNPQALLEQAQEVKDRAISMGTIKAPGSNLPSEQRAFEALVLGMSAEDEIKARRIKLRLDAGAVGSADQTIAADEGLTTQVGESKAEIAGLVSGASEGAKQQQRLKFAPTIAKAVKLAETEAAARGETLTGLQRAQAALPGLQDAVKQLRTLAPLVTSTIAGKTFNALAKELGFGATKGSTARARFISIIDNQVLPLLKATFGGSFSIQEGESLKATLGDPDAAPAEKMAQLDSFINQKMREIETSQRELGLQSEASQTTPASDLGRVSDEDLIKMLQGQ